MADRLVDFAEALDEIYRIAIEQRVDLVVDTGDTFDSPDPDPYSVRAFRQFVEKLTAAGIKFLGITGNHNYHSIGKLISHGSWMDAVSDKIISPSGSSEPISIFSKDGACSISVACFDWMSSDKIDSALSAIPRVVDAIFMHQSCEGFMPVIGRPEMVLAQVDGKARYAGIGDIHVTKKQITQSGTVVGSAGSTEMAKSDEPPQKYAIVVSFDTDKAKEPTWEPIEIKTRRIITYPCIRSEEQIEGLRGVVDNFIASGPSKKPMVMASYLRFLGKNMEAFRQSLISAGVTLVRFLPEPDVESIISVVEEKTNNSTSMNEILVEILQDEDAKNLALSLWANPEQSSVIIERYKASVIERKNRESP